MNYISIYRFKDAPQQWRDLSTNGGDEDWLAFVPDSLKSEYMPFLEEGSGRFGNIVDSYDVAGGVVLISSHA